MMSIIKNNAAIKTCNLNEFIKKGERALCRPDPKPKYDEKEMRRIFGEYFALLPLEYKQLVREFGKWQLGLWQMKIEYSNGEVDYIGITILHCDPNISYDNLLTTLENIRDLEPETLPAGVFPIGYIGSGYQGNLYIDLRLKNEVSYGVISWERGAEMVKISNNLNELFSKYFNEPDSNA